MTVLPFGIPGQFWRGNLHTHSNGSDGAWSPDRTARVYREAGYDFVAITDHFRPEYGFPVTDTRELRSAGFTTLIGAELHAPRTELGQSWHIVAVGLPLDFEPPAEAETGPELARRARAAGAFIGMAHPSASLLTAVDAESLDAAHSVEVYNALADRENRGDSWHLTDVLLNRGHRLTTYAADDAHLQPQDPPPCQAWVHVRTETLDPDALLAALKAGHFYSSTGPELYDVRIEDDVVVVRCSPATKILLSGGHPGAEVAQSIDLTEAALPLALFRGTHCRITVEDAAGGRAWTNPIHLPPVDNSTH
ncbi:CehA/McbA family metallohydrolase [Kribbella sp. CA-293567]|uniref:CehA/McbA family metallohydrolase n=1 Tax=Kribbella sp. CA-293567 TaxID=3002436 RepID=UPI0022DD3292|nr:CehA/McbA family metallohydrolase [Kribbella sp. CA-293567]WBQ07306.1 CehA/McbA family metallohydrolase [Kribbella sp. CA-293567]